MRHIHFATLIALFLMPFGNCLAFEVEDRIDYPASAATQSIRILSTADINVFEPIILAFQAENPKISIDYQVASSSEVMRAIYQENAEFDLVISSAMDLQTKLANDGFAQTYISDATRTLPNRAKWHNQVFAFTQEPAVLVVSKDVFRKLSVPSTRQELITLLRNYPDTFRGKIGTYDVRTSGLGYLFATQDSRNTETFWQLTEVMGRLDTKLYCCSGDMIADVSAGKIAIAYNVLGSYANSQLATTPNIKIVPMNDFVSVMLRTALIPRTSNNAAVSGLMIDFLAKLSDRPKVMERTGLQSIDVDMEDRNKSTQSIRLGPGLLVFLDQMRRENFIRIWENSILQN